MKLYFEFKKIIQLKILEFITEKENLYFTNLFNLYIKIFTKDNFKLRCHKQNNIYKFTDTTGEIFYTQPVRSKYLVGSITNRLEKLSNEYLLEYINFETNDVILDCGANIGELYKIVEKILDKNFNYYGFEPSKQNFSALKLNSHNFIKENVALSDKDGIFPIYINDKYADTSLIPSDNFVYQDEVKTIRLDGLEELKNEHIKLLKIDAEGSELNVIIGAKNLLSNIEFISVDLGFENYDAETKKYISTLGPVVNYLFQNNFELLDTFRLTRKTYIFKNKKFISK